MLFFWGGVPPSIVQQTPNSKLLWKPHAHLLKPIPPLATERFTFSQNVAYHSKKGWFGRWIALAFGRPLPSKPGVASGVAVDLVIPDYWPCSKGLVGVRGRKHREGTAVATPALNHVQHKAGPFVFAWLMVRKELPEFCNVCFHVLLIQVLSFRSSVSGANRTKAVSSLPYIVWKRWKCTSALFWGLNFLLSRLSSLPVLGWN